MSAVIPVVALVQVARCLTVLGALGLAVLSTLLTVQMVTAVRLAEAIADEWQALQQELHRRFDAANLLAYTLGPLANQVTGAREVRDEVMVTGSADQNLWLRPYWLREARALRCMDAAHRRLTEGVRRLERMTRHRTDRSVPPARVQTLHEEMGRLERAVDAARERLNVSIGRYNGALQRFPFRLVAGWFGFAPKTAYDPSAWAPSTDTRCPQYG